MFFASVFYCVNNDVFHETKFFNTKEEVHKWCKKTYAIFMLSCESDLEVSLDANKLMPEMTYKDDHMFHFDYGTIKIMEKEIIDEGFDSDKERKIK